MGMSSCIGSTPVVQYVQCGIVNSAEMMECAQKVPFRCADLWPEPNSACREARIDECIDLLASRQGRVNAERVPFLSDCDVCRTKGGKGEEDSVDAKDRNEGRSRRSVRQDGLVHRVERSFHRLIDATCIYDFQAFGLLFNTLAITGEAGELAECVKKLYTRSSLNVHRLAKVAVVSDRCCGPTGPVDGRRKDADGSKQGPVSITAADRLEIVGEIADLRYYLYQVQRSVEVSDEEVLETLCSKLCSRSDERLLGQRDARRGNCGAPFPAVELADVELGDCGRGACGKCTVTRLEES
jgi:NTP pyrophosphatase (non-canonical NTP hydrolase)